MLIRNQKPTMAEEELFKYAGFYPIEVTYDENAQLEYIKYCPVHTEKRKRSYPKRINTDVDTIETNYIIEFFVAYEAINIKGIIDLDILDMIQTRAEELQFQRYVLSKKEDTAN